MGFAKRNRNSMTKRARVPDGQRRTIFETNPAEFLIAGRNFGKITSLRGYCLAVLRVPVVLARLEAYRLRDKHIRGYVQTHMYTRARTFTRTERERDARTHERDNSRAVSDLPP